MLRTFAGGRPARIAGDVMGWRWWFALVLVIPVGPVRAGEPQPEIGRLRAHVATLASPAFGGRRGEGGRKAAEYIEGAFRELGLRPLFGDRYEQPIPGRG